MPPKKKNKGKKKGKGGDKETGAEGEGEKKPEPTEKELELRKELEKITEKLRALKLEVEGLRQENEWLQEEAQKTRLESHEYMSYMSKKTQKRQTTIITLSDRNQQELQDINDQKEQLLTEYGQKKDELKALMLEKEAELAMAKNELADLEEYQLLQKEQEAEIARLENEVQSMRKKHSEAIQKLKSSFLREKRGYQQESDSKIQEMAQQATQEARHCLEEHTNNVKNENKILRQQLLQLIRRTRALHEHREELEAQHKALLREIQYGRDLKKLQGTRQKTDTIYFVVSLVVS
ncbi:coiled-coil domain-containing protein 153-like, partial [Actinia tenebrosa]|uniref:Coiled-coil domain-containing protein 153-like n=1 Tax=Actinia tenebrosa TaxID=6105 RepID=A0A6P8J4W1_ACTTE